MNKLRRAQTFLIIPLMIASLIVLAAVPSHPQSAAASEINFQINPSQSKLEWTLGATMHAVHGTFQIKRGSMRITPASGIASGEIVADATSGKTQNDSRDRKMHQEVLESGRFSEIIFRPDHVVGKLEPQGTSTVQLHGIMTLHGSDHEMTIPVKAQLDASRWSGTAQFTVPYIAWGLKNPSNFLLKVEPDVTVNLDLAGSR